MTATDKQKKFMTDLKLPWDENTSFEEAKTRISAKMANVNNVPVKQVIAPDKPMRATVDKASYYVAYAKDLCIAMLKGNSPNEDETVRAMKLSIQMIKDAKEAFS